MNLACMDVINIVVCAEWPRWHIMVHQLANELNVHMHHFGLQLLHTTRRFG